MQAGDRLFAESPLGSLQHARNASLVRACAQCMRPIGTLDDQLDRLLRARPSAALAALVSPADAAMLVADADASFPGLGMPSGGTLPLLVSPADAFIAPVVPCAWGCRAEYCGVGCRDEATKRHHALFCPAPRAVAAAAAAAAAAGMPTPRADDENVNAAELFIRQALATNEIFILAGRLVARVLEGWARTGNDLVKAMAPISLLHSEPWPSLFEIRMDATEKKRILMGLDGGDEDEDEEEEEEEEEEEDSDDNEGKEEMGGDAVMGDGELARTPCGFGGHKSAPKSEADI